MGMIEKKAKYVELIPQGFKIIRWYKSKIGDEWEHLVCIRNDSQMILQFWNTMKGSGSHMLWFDDKDEANAKVVELLQKVPKEHLKLRDRDEIIRTMALIDIDSSFVQ